MKDYNVQVKVRNNKLLSIMRDRGISTNAELSRVAKIHESAAGLMMNLKVTAYNTRGELRPIVQKVCDALYCFVEDIYPENHFYHSLHKNVAEVELGAAQVEQLLDHNSPEHIAEIGDAVSDISHTLKDALTDRERDIINKRYGMDGSDIMLLTEIAKEYGLSSDRIRQIEVSALRKLRLGKRSKPLLQHLEVLSQ